MIPIYFKAEYLPNYRVFKVSVKFKNKKWVERMTISKFMRFAKNDGKPLVIDGRTIVVEGDPDNSLFTTVRFRDPVNIDGFQYLMMGKWMNVEQEPVKWGFSQKA